MRVRRCQCIIGIAIIINIIVLYYFWRMQNTLDSHLQVGVERFIEEENKNKIKEVFVQSTTNSAAVEQKQYSSAITIIFREFELFENDLKETISSFVKLIENIKILVLVDKYPYPPFYFPKKDSVNLIILHPYPESDPSTINIFNYITTPYVLFVPDSVRITSLSQIKHLLDLIKLHSNSIIAAKINKERSKCLKMDVRLRDWTLSYFEPSDLDNNCNCVLGPHVILMQTVLLMNLSQPVARPFPHALFIQTALRNIQVQMSEQSEFQQGKPLFLDSHIRWKHDSIQRERLHYIYNSFGIKKLVQLNKEVEWFGCNKHSARCFGTVWEDIPSYIFEGRWTPPCCLEALRKTTRHVITILQKAGVRHWLEGGSLLGAARNGDIIPWDYDVDLGIYQDDINKCKWLQRAQEKPTADNEGFVWEKAVEGDFFRVQYSKSNHMHVDLFPFYSKNGIMTKRTWFKTHRQDTEFPEHFLRPLTTINFVGIQASAPNNIRDFLELKFGEDVIENPQYPNVNKLKLFNISTTNIKYK